MMIRAVIFDLYDTLLYLTDPIVQETRHAIALRAGVDPDAWAALWRGNVVDRMLGKMGGLDDEIRGMLEQLGPAPPPALVAELVEEQIAGWAAIRARLAFLCKAHACPVIDTRWNVHFQLPL